MIPVILLAIALLALFFTSREAVRTISPEILNLCRKAFLYMKQRDYQKALETYSSILTLKPDSLEALANRGNAHYFLKEYDEAVADYSRAIELQPAFSAAYNNRGTTYLAMGRVDEALEDLTMAVQLNPRLSEAYFNRAEAHSEKGEVTQALADLEQASAIDPNDKDVLFQRATLLLKMNKNRDLALADLDAFLNYNHSHPRARYLRGLYYLEQGEYQKAIDDFSRAIELKSDSFRPFYRRGVCYAEQGEYQKAIDDFSRAIELNPAHVEGFYRRGILWLENREYQLALDDFNQLLTLVPRSGKAHAFRALARQGMGDLDGARGDLDIYFSGENIPEDRLALYEDLAFLAEHLKRKDLLEEELEAELEMSDLSDTSPPGEPESTGAVVTGEPAADQAGEFTEEETPEMEPVNHDRVTIPQPENGAAQPPPVDRLSEMIQLMMNQDQPGQ